LAKICAVPEDIKSCRLFLLDDFCPAGGES